MSADRGNLVLTLRRGERLEVRTPAGSHGSGHSIDIELLEACQERVVVGIRAERSVSLLRSRAKRRTEHDAGA